MCRLLGLMANRVVDLEFSLERLEEYSIQNPDGWGIGWYKDDKAQVFKQGFSVDSEDSDYAAISRSVESMTIIAHVRQMTEGEPANRNSHPFKLKNWIFAHNGGVDREHLLPLLTEEHHDALQGETDSEVFFYWILQCMEDKQDPVAGIDTAVKKIVEGIQYSSLNFLLSDGNKMYTFHYSDKAREHYSLYRLNRDPALPGPISIESEETKVLLHSKALKGESAILICSEKLTEEDWEEIPFGNLVIVDQNLKMDEFKIL